MAGWGETYTIEVRDEGGRAVAVVGMTRGRYVLEAYVGTPGGRALVERVSAVRADGRSVSARDLRRLPLASLIQRSKILGPRALELYEAYGAWPTPLRFQTEELMRELARGRAPRGRPQRGRSIDFYRQVADFYRDARARGLRPSIEIARRKRVSPNLARQWIYRARRLGFLPPVEEG